MHPVDMIFSWAEMAPARPAVVQSDMVITYRGLADAIGSAAHRVEQLGLDRSEPVAVCIESPAKLLAVSLALLHSGFAAAPITRGSLLYLMSAGIKNVIYDAEGLVLSGGRNIRFQDSWLLGDAEPGAKRASLPRRPSKEAPLVFFTSGTTGRPKKIIHTPATQLHRLHVSGLTGEADFATVLFMPGMGGSYGFNRGCGVLHKGGTLCIGPRFEIAAGFVATFKVELLIASPAQAQGLSEFLENNPGYDLGSLQEIRIAGGSVSAELLHRIQSAVCRNVIIEYASTEAGIVGFAPYDAIRDIPGAAGILAPWAELEVVDASGNVLPTGEEGIIRCRTGAFSASFAANYPQSSGDPDQAWWYPGDVGRLNERRVIIISGRTDDLINRGGVKASAVALDEIISSYTGVKDAGVCVAPGENGLAELWVAVVLERSTDSVALQRSIGASGSLPMTIDRFFVVEEIPRTDLGKIRRNDLRDRLQRLNTERQ